MKTNNQFTVYEIIASDIREKIENNYYKPGEKLPSISELCSKYLVSDSTIRKSLDILKNEGYIYSKKRVGIFVNSIKEKKFVLKFNEFENLKSAIEKSKIITFFSSNYDELNDLKMNKYFLDKKFIVCHRMYYSKAFPILYKIDYILYNAKINIDLINIKKWINEMDRVMGSPFIKKKLSIKIEAEKTDIRKVLILAEQSILYNIKREYFTEKDCFVGLSYIYVANNDIKLSIYKK